MGWFAAAVVLSAVARGEIEASEAVLAAAQRALEVQRSLQEESRGIVVGYDYMAMTSERVRDGKGRVPVREVSAKDLARAERAEETAATEAEARARLELKGKYFWHPPRGAVKDYPQQGEASASLATMLLEAVEWTRGVRGAWDPIYAREVLGMKGMKHFTEWLDLLRLAAAAGDERARTAAASLVREIVPGVLADPGYHAWLTFPTDSWRFRQDSMSYVRAHVICAELGLDPGLLAVWRRRIVGVLPRIWMHLESRGIDQKLNFLKLFRSLRLYHDPAASSATDVVVSERERGRGEPPPLLPTTEDLDAFEAVVFETTLIRRRVPLGWYMLSPDRPYDVTHEIFALTDDGRRPFPFREGDARRSLALAAPDAPARDALYDYALDTVETLLRLHARRDALDVVCEYVVNLAQLGLRVPRRPPRDRRHTLYLDALAYIRSRRNADGSFGETHDQELVRIHKRNPTYDTRLGGTLHTTYVCLWALSQPVYDDDPFPSYRAVPPDLAPWQPRALAAAADDRDDAETACPVYSSLPSSDQGDLDDSPTEPLAT